MRGLTKAGLAALALVAATALYCMQGDTVRTEAASVQSRPAPVRGETLDDVRVPAPGDTQARRADVPLPPHDAQLATIIEPLAARADAGDAKAACRLAMELIRCQQVNFFQPLSSLDGADNEAEQEAKGNLDAADEIAQSRLALLVRAQECQAVPDRLKGRGGHYLGQAARAGEPEAMVRYANVEFWPPDARGAFADPEFDRWRRDAPSLLLRAFSEGVPESALVMMDAYQSNFGAVGSMIEDDPVKAAAMRMLMARLFGWPDHASATGLDASSFARARELAKQWHEGPFKGRSYRGQNRAMFQPPGYPRHDGAPHQFCTGDALTP